MLNKLQFELITDPSIWENICESSDSNNYMGSWSWGELKEKSGWKVTRLILRRGKYQLALQAFVKEKFLIRLIYLPHFPFGDHEFFDVNDIINSFPKSKFKLNYVRASLIDILNKRDFFNMQSMGFHQVFFEGNTRLTFTKNIRDLENNWIDKLPRNRRKAVSIVYSDQLSVEFKSLSECDPNELREFFNSFYDYKKQNVYLSNQIPLLQKYFGDQLKLIIVREESRIVSLRGALLYKDYAYDFWAAHLVDTNNKYLSELALIKLIDNLKSCGTKFFEFGGADPINNKGVYFFKKSFNFDKNLKLGEWSFCDLPFRIILDYLISKQVR